MKFVRSFFLAIFIIAFGACTIIDTGHRGVKTRFGVVEGGSLPEGFYSYNFFTSDIVEIDVRERKQEISTQAYTKDLQQVKVDSSVVYYPDRDNVHLIYQDVGTEWDTKIVPQIILGKIKEVIGQFDAEVLVNDRVLAINQISNSLKKDLEKKRIVLTDFQLTNLDYNEAFENSVERKVVASQDAVAAKNKTVQIEEESKQKLITAKAEAESMRIRSEALIQNKNLVEYEAVQKWNGILPSYMMGDSVPFINLSK